MSSKRTRKLLRRGTSRLEAGRWADAIRSFADVLVEQSELYKFPPSSRVGRAASHGIERAVASCGAARCALESELLSASDMNWLRACRMYGLKVHGLAQAGDDVVARALHSFSERWTDCFRFLALVDAHVVLQVIRGEPHDVLYETALLRCIGSVSEGGRPKGLLPIDISSLLAIGLIALPHERASAVWGLACGGTFFMRVYQQAKFKDFPLPPPPARYRAMVEKSMRRCIHFMGLDVDFDGVLARLE